MTQIIDWRHPGEWMTSDGVHWLCFDEGQMRAWVTSDGRGQFVVGAGTDLEYVVALLTTNITLAAWARAWHTCTAVRYLHAIANAPAFQAWPWRAQCGLDAYLAQRRTRMLHWDISYDEPAQRCMCDILRDGCHCAAGRAELDRERKERRNG